jgi:hypothetical protein
VDEQPTFRKRGRPRRTRIDMSAQTEPFPMSREPEPAREIRADAEDKRKVADAVKEIPQIFTPENVEWCFDVYVAVLSFLYSFALKTQFTAIQDELEFSDEQKKQLAVPLAKVLSKYAPKEWAGRTDEIQLITMMGIWTVSSIQRARNIAKKEEEKKRDAERTQPVAPMRREPAREIHVSA